MTGAALTAGMLTAGVLSTPAFGAEGDDPVPRAPRVASDGTYKECAGGPCPESGEPGLPGSFTFRPNEADIDPATGKTDVTAYLVRLQGEEGATLVSGAEASHIVIPPSDGMQTLEVQARDRGERWGPRAYFKFNVKPAPGAVSHWRFADRPTDPSVTTTKDTATEGTERHDATLMDGAGWSERGRRGADDFSLDLNSTAPAKQKAYASTSGPVVDSKDSFTVSAWAYLDGTKSDQVLLSAPGKQDSAFALYYSARQKKWAFGRGAKDVKGTVDAVSYGEAAGPPARVWTHLAGVFDTKRDADRTNDTVQLFVDGRPQGQPVRLSAAAPAYEPWTSSEGLQIGRAKRSGSYQQYFHGYVDEVRIWQRALRPMDVVQVSTLSIEGSPATELVADWNADHATGRQIADLSGYGRPALALSPQGAQLRADGAGRRELALDGAKGYAAASGPVIDETGSFTVSARVRVDSALWAAKPNGYRATVAGQKLANESSWALVLTKIVGEEASWYVWSFERTAVDARGKVTERVKLQSNTAMEPEQFDVPLDVTGVFNAAGTSPGAVHNRPGELALYISTTAVGGSAYAELTSQGTGELAAGRGASDGTTGHYFPGGLERLRLWSGAMTANGLMQVLEEGAAG